MFLLYFISILFLYYLGSFPPPVFAVDFLFTFISLFGFISLSSGDRDFDSRNDFLQPIGTSGQASRWDKPTVHPRCRNLPDHEDPQCYSHFFFQEFGSFWCPNFGHRKILVVKIPITITQNSQPYIQIFPHFQVPWREGGRGELILYPKELRMLHPWKVG